MSRVYEPLNPAEAHVLQPCVAHWRMLSNMLERYGCQNIPTGVIPCCTLEFVRTLGLPKTILPRNKLSTCIEVFGLPASNSHDALDDARACLELFRFLTS